MATCKRGIYRILWLRMNPWIFSLVCLFRSALTETGRWSSRSITRYHRRNPWKRCQLRLHISHPKRYDPYLSWHACYSYVCNNWYNTFQWLLQQLSCYWSSRQNLPSQRYISCIKKKEINLRNVNFLHHTAFQLII